MTLPVAGHRPGACHADAVQHQETTSPTFSERLWPSWPAWLVAPGLGLGTALSLLPVGVAASLVGAALVTAAAVAGLVAASPVVKVAGGELWAGRAHVPLRLVGDPVAAAGEEARLERGPRLDARAYLCIRGWVGPVVRVPLEDPADPTPYWLVSTRRPVELVGAIAAARQG